MGGARLRVFNGGFLTQTRVRRILALAGWPVWPGWPRAGDAVGVWGHSPTAWRGERIAALTGAPVLRVEDAFLRSVRPGRSGDPPLGLLLDRRGVHFNSAAPSDLEVLLATHPLEDPELLSRAETAMLKLMAAHLTKYSGVDPVLPLPDPGYVLVVDQTRGDASIRHGGAGAASFERMLAAARAEHPGARLVLKTHPETASGRRPGHFDRRHEDARTRLLTDPVSPWPLLAGAAAVYAVSSQLGFKAILAGHRPRLFGQPFYAGWGLSEDTLPVHRRRRVLTPAQLFAAAMILYPAWYDPHRDRLCPPEDAMLALEAGSRAWREDRAGYVASGMRLWKRGPLQRMFGRERRLVFEDDPARASARAAALGRPLLVWAGRQGPAHAAPMLIRVEDGFLRSRGLGADLVPPLSLVADPLGIYYDPARPSALERLIAASPALTPTEIARSARIIGAVRAHRLSKYNIRGDVPDLPPGCRILVPGQVEDDASVLRGCSGIAGNRGLLLAARVANPDVVLIYKPHPDVEAGLRRGAVPDAAALADTVAAGADPAALLEQVEEVWTLTSLLGFEALLRGRRVTCLGAPFYAGWGLTTDLGPVPSRRTARPTLEMLAHAALIGYPRYHDPVTGSPCPVEVVLERLAHGPLPAPGPANRLLARAQGLLASRARLWR